jgi:beta-glucosidase
MKAGLFDAPMPSAKAVPLQANLGSEEHRIVAREAVRKSMVLLKNNGSVLPISGSAEVLVAGSGANSIEMQTGGWTITWQGTGNSNETFPGATSIYAAIDQALTGMGGSATLSVDGSYTKRPDVAIVVFGETPYAEGQGDVDTLAWQQEDPRDLRLLQQLQSEGVPVVAVLLTGRPLWMNAELNASDAFVVAWLPGSEGGGIADVLIADAEDEVRYDFHGRLSFDWPNKDLNANDPALPVDDILFEYGYGLRYAEPGQVGDLDETPVGKSDSLDRLIFGGTARDPWQTFIGDEMAWETDVRGSQASTMLGELQIRTFDRRKQEDSIELMWSGTGDSASQVYWRSAKVRDLSSITSRGGYLVLDMQVVEPPRSDVMLRVDCDYPCSGEIDLTATLAGAPTKQWRVYAIPLSCFAEKGADLTKVSSPAVVTTNAAMTLRISEIALRVTMPAGAVQICP